MAISCPNKNTQEWKDLVQEFGEVEAMLAYVKNNEVIPSVEEAKNILVESFPSYEEDPTLQYKKDLEFHINTIHVVSNFLEKIGVGTRFVQEFFSKGGSVIENALAAANFIEGTVDIIDDVEKRPSAWNKLPEEAAHWWYRLLNKNSALKDALLTSAKTTRKEEELRKSLYGNTYKGPKIIGKLALDEQGNITNLPVLSPIREEAIGQLIAEAIKRIETKEGSPSDYSFLDMFIKWINKMIDIFKSIKKDPFEIAAMKILSSDISDLLSFEEYKNIHNEVYFTDKLTNRSVDPIDISLMEEISNGIVLKDEDSGYYMLYNPTIDEALSPQFPSKEQLEIWLYDIYGKEYDKKQKEIIEEVEDNQDFVDYILNKTENGTECVVSAIPGNLGPNFKGYFNESDIYRYVYYDWEVNGVPLALNQYPSEGTAANNQTTLFDKPGDYTIEARLVNDYYTHPDYKKTIASAKQTIIIKDEKKKDKEKKKENEGVITKNEENSGELSEFYGDYWLSFNHIDQMHAIECETSSYITRIPAIRETLTDNDLIPVKINRNTFSVNYSRNSSALQQSEKITGTGKIYKDGNTVKMDFSASFNLSGGYSITANLKYSGSLDVNKDFELNIISGSVTFSGPNYSEGGTVKKNARVFFAKDKRY